jgi:ABC-type transport system involved in cytochrome c biogenesis permease subunit
LTPGVDTLVPALQSYWLNIHVIIILSGYATATLAMVLGHVALGIEAFKPNDRDLFLTSTKTTYRVIQMSMLLLFAGTILGGVWAHEAWGRYWGWDPKETWALISWFGYVGVAHARFAGWLTPRGLALAAIGVYPLILMTYYGVNYLLSGLHSYAGGESAQVPPLLIGFLVFEAIVVLIGVKGWHTKEGRNSSSKSGQSNSGAEN